MVGAAPGGAIRDERDVLDDERQKALIPEIGLEIPSYQIRFGIPPYLATIVISLIDPSVRLVLLAVMVVMVVMVMTLNMDTSSGHVPADAPNKVPRGTWSTMRNLTEYTSHTLIRPERLHDQLRLVRLTGTALSRGESVPGDWTIAAPLFGAEPRGSCRSPAPKPPTPPGVAGPGWSCSWARRPPGSGRRWVSVGGRSGHDQGAHCRPVELRRQRPYGMRG
jgi:Bacterial transcriptional regulator